LGHIRTIKKESFRDTFRKLTLTLFLVGGVSETGADINSSNSRTISSENIYLFIYSTQPNKLINIEFKLSVYTTADYTLT